MILELVARRPGGLTNAQVSRYFGVATSTCSYILGRLESHGYLKRAQDSGRYDIGTKLVGLAHSVPPPSPFQSILLPPLQSLVNDTRLTAAVGVLRGGRVLLVGHVDTPEPLRVNLGTGSEVEFDTSALGKVLVAWLPAQEAAELVERFGLSKGNSRNNARTGNSPFKFFRELELVRKQGYAINNNVLGARSVAAPIVSTGGAVPAAVVATGATSQAVWKRHRDLVDRLKAAAQEIASGARSVDWQQLV
jgi:IclR family acetate operon transcriptional repressor